uniref:Leukocyte elastase inhibitor A-like n=1 Tax=Neolamprologus brichardi TaxID=32507 RepID=A0A3Q4MSH4_NEOBR
IEGFETASTAFSLAMLKTLSEEDSTGNIFYSGLSVSAALAMLMLGARGSTATQMSEVEYAHVDDVHAKFAKLLTDLNKADAPYSLSLANRLYGDRSCTFLEEFLKGTKKHYNAELESVDFKGNAEEARVHINSWVEKQTQDKIKDLLSQDAVDSLTKLVLVNAIYFKGSWNTQFKEEMTADAQFRLNKNDTKPVKMMQQKSKFPFATIPEANYALTSTLRKCPVSIRQASDTVSAQLEKELTYQNFVDWTHPDMMSPNEVDVKLPRFKMEEKYDLEKILTKMGMENAFDIFANTLTAGEARCCHLALSVAAHVALSEMNEKKKMAVTQLASYTSCWLVELLLHVQMQILQRKQKYIKSSFFQHIFVSFSSHFLCKML